MPTPPKNTQEIVAMWNSVVEDRWAGRLGAVLRELLPRRGLATPGEAQSVALARDLIRALQIAAAPKGGVAAAVDYLATVGAPAEPA
ncbi:MAG TPA: hypothetical protein VFU46_05355 [Gemmatimonadales bacterium]|nr:hypothetical protein [Gemmatimonadales bacterium]